MKLEAEQVIIPNGTALSAIIDLRSRTLRGIIMPTSWTAADITFVGAAKDTDTFVNVVDWDGVQWACTAVASTCITPRQEVGEALPFIKIRSSSTSDNTAAVNQGADRTITLLTSPRQV